MKTMTTETMLVTVLGGPPYNFFKITNFLKNSCSLKDAESQTVLDAVS